MPIVWLDKAWDFESEDPSPSGYDGQYLQLERCSGFLSWEVRWKISIQVYVTGNGRFVPGPAKTRPWVPAQAQFCRSCILVHAESM